MKLKIIYLFSIFYTILTFLPFHNIPPIEIKLSQSMRIIFEIVHYLIFSLFLILTFIVVKNTKLKKIYTIISIPLILYTILGIYVSYINQGQKYVDVRFYYSKKSKIKIVEQLYLQGVYGTESRLVIIKKNFHYFRVIKVVDETEFEK